MLTWNTPDTLNEVDEHEVIMIRHNRGTWIHKRDPERVNCVVVFRAGDRFKQFGPDYFTRNEIAAWARFNPR